MSDPNILISNGTCYTAAGEKLDASFIPCGNDAYGYHTCCGAGDNCLADSSCFGFHGSGYGSYLTYMAGCSDPTYSDSSCPKKDVDQPWIALTLCDNSDGAWAACSQSGNPTTLRPGSYCSCTDAASATVQFTDATSLTSICSLPSSTGESIDFFAGHTPSGSLTSATAATTTASASGSSVSSGSATASQTGSSASSQSGTGAGNSGSTTSTKTGSTTTSKSSQSSTGSGKSGSTTSTQTGSDTSSQSGTGAGSSGTSIQTGSTTSSSSGTGAVGSGTTSSSGNGTTTSGLSPGAKIGIGVGAAVGALIVLAMIVAFFLLRRRKRRRSQPEMENGSPNDTKTSKLDSSDVQRFSAASVKPGVHETDGQPVSEADGQAAQPWNTRSELEGSPVIPYSADHVGQGLPRSVPHEGQIKANGDLGPVTQMPGSGEGQVSAQGSGHGPQPVPRYRGVETTTQAPPNRGGLSVVGPEGIRFPGE